MSTQKLQDLSYVMIEGKPLPDWSPIIEDGKVAGFIVDYTFMHWMMVVMSYLRTDAPIVYDCVIKYAEHTAPASAEPQERSE